MADKTSVCIVGSGNWGSAIAKIVGANCARLPEFEDVVPMFVYEETINGKKLTEIINTTHENVKYLPGYKLPENVVAIPDLVEAAKNADILIFVVPHQFIPNFCKTLLGKIRPNAIAVSLIKGFDKAEGGGIDLISHIITRHLKIPCMVLMGANLANEVAEGNFCETTIGCQDVKYAKTLRDLFQSENFRVVVVDDSDAVEVCGALKNIVACGAGFVDGLGLGDNTKAAIIRLGLMEMIRFVDVFYPGSKLSTFFESCGVADLITTCYGGRNRKVSEALVKTGKSIEELEKEMLNGQKLQGPATAEEVNYMLKAKGLLEKFPLFTAIHRVCINEIKPQDLVDCIRNHPEHMKIAAKKSATLRQARVRPNAVAAAIISKCFSQYHRKYCKKNFNNENMLEEKNSQENGAKSFSEEKKSKEICLTFRGRTRSPLPKLIACNQPKQFKPGAAPKPLLKSLQAQEETALNLLPKNVVVQSDESKQKLSYTKIEKPVRKDTTEMAVKNSFICRCKAPKNRLAKFMAANQPRKFEAGAGPKPHLKSMDNDEQIQAERLRKAKNKLRLISNRMARKEEEEGNKMTQQTTSSKDSSQNFYKPAIKKYKNAAVVGVNQPKVFKPGTAPKPTLQPFEYSAMRKYCNWNMLNSIKTSTTFAGRLAYAAKSNALPTFKCNQQPTIYFNNSLNAFNKCISCAKKPKGLLQFGGMTMAAAGACMSAVEVLNGIFKKK